jgi:hypothetical protein
MGNRGIPPCRARRVSATAGAASSLVVRGRGALSGRGATETRRRGATRSTPETVEPWDVLRPGTWGHVTPKSR